MRRKAAIPVRLNPSALAGCPTHRPKARERLLSGQKRTLESSPESSRSVTLTAKMKAAARALSQTGHEQSRHSTIASAPGVTDLSKG
jgi:hypothetical protein